jgi:hypothetical protein
VGEGEGVGSGCWIEREGRESLREMISYLHISGEPRGFVYRSTFKETE